MTNVAI